MSRAREVVGEICWVGVKEVGKVDEGVELGVAF